MVLDLRTSGLDVISAIVLIRARFWRDVRLFASELLPSSVRAPFIKVPSHLITSANSDGGLSLDRQVLDPRGEELGDVDQKYDNLVCPSIR